MIQEWYAKWFDSPYYHILYGDRDEAEAEYFLDQLLGFLNPKVPSFVLDLACGQGRHSRYLAKHGHIVTGIDLSEENIRYARSFEFDQLHFYKHDMRHLFRINYYDYIFNFFTSFGYFDKYKDHLDTIKSICKGLKKEGIFVLDFMNAEKVLATIIKEEEKTIKGIHFRISRRVEGKRIVKSIQIQDNQNEFQFEEKVWALTLPDLDAMLKKVCLTSKHVFGSYDLDPFDAQNSNRLILITQKSK